jgi:hypothetical protein
LCVQWKGEAAAAGRYLVGWVAAAAASFLTACLRIAGLIRRSRFLWVRKPVISSTASIPPPAATTCAALRSFGLESSARLGGRRRVLLVEEDREGAAGAGAVAARGDLRPHSALAARLLALDSGLLLRFPAHLLLEPPLVTPVGLRGSPLLPQQLLGLPELPARLRPREVPAERRVPDAVLGSERPQPLASRPTANELRVGNEPTERTVALGPSQLPGLPELPARVRPAEETAERRVPDAVVRGERPQRLTGRPAAKQLRVGNEPTQSTLALHPRILALA